MSPGAVLQIGVDLLDEQMTDARGLTLPTRYTDLLGEPKERIRSARTKSILERQAMVGTRSHRQTGRGLGSRVP